MLGVARLVLLGRRDSGLPGWRSGTHRRALAAADTLRAGPPRGRARRRRGRRHGRPRRRAGHLRPPGPRGDGPDRGHRGRARRRDRLRDDHRPRAPARRRPRRAPGARGRARGRGRVRAGHRGDRAGGHRDGRRTSRTSGPRSWPTRARSGPRTSRRRRSPTPTATSGTAAPARPACWTAWATPTSSPRPTSPHRGRAR